MKRKSGIKNPAIFAIISFVAIIGVSFMLVFSAVASSNSAAAPAEETPAVVQETVPVQEVAQTTAEPVEMKVIEETKKAEAPAKDTPAPELGDETEAALEESEEADYTVDHEIELLEADDTVSEPEADEDVSDLSGMVAYINEDQVNFRSAPDSDDDSNIIYVLYAGSAHSVLRTEGDWTVVYVDGFGEGYVYSGFVSLEEGGETSSYDSVVAAANGAAAAGNDRQGHMEYEEDDEEYEEEDYSESYEYAYINDDHINFRSSMSTGSSDNIICALNYGTTHYYLGSEDGWINIYVDGYGEGYVSSAYVTLTNDGEITSYEYVAASEDNDDDDYSEDWDEEEEYVDYSDPYASLRQEVVDYACSFAGWLPYVWGSHSLTYGADCSGFTSAVYATFGYSLSCDSEVQSRQGYSVPLSEILPGDIIVYSGHVAMYVGDGLKVHSPYPGTVVTIDSMYYTTILDVRRIIG